MKKEQFFIFFACAFFALILQTVVVKDFPGMRVWTDLTFYLVIILGLRFSLLTGFITAWLLGYINDSVSFISYGATTISYLASLIFIRNVKKNIYIENRSALFFWIVVFSSVRQLTQLGVMTLSGRSYGDWWMILPYMTLQAAWDGFLGMLIVPLLEKALNIDWKAAFRKKGLKG